MKKYILTVTLNPAIDKTVKVRSFGLGSDHRVSDINVSAGGKGLNVSRALKCLGHATVATGIVGGWAGEFILSELKRECIKNDFLVTCYETRTNLTVIDPGTGKITRLIEPGPGLTSGTLNAFEKKFKALLKNASFAVFTGSNACGFPDGIYQKLIRISRAKGVPAALDTRGKPMLLGLEAKPYIVKPNIEEAELALGERLDSMKKIERAAVKLRNKGASIAIITMDAKGSVGYDGKELIRVPSPRVACVNDVGCGDAFLAAFIVSQSKGMSFRASLEAASSVGALNAMTDKPGDIRIPCPGIEERGRWAKNKACKCSKYLLQL